MTAPRTIAPILALDIGNVSLHIDPLPLLNHIGFDTMDDFLAHDTDKKIWDGCMAFEEGNSTRDEFAQWFSTIVPKELSAADVPEIWGILLRDEIEGMADVVELAVANGVKPVFLSDICPIRYEMSCKILSFTHHMVGAILSYEVGRHKPHEAMYIAMEDQFCDGGVPLLYADDLAHNVEAARTRGWAAYQFGNARDMRDILLERLEELE